MWDLIKVSIRNVGRNKRRSLITILTVFIGVVVAASTRGLLNGLQNELRSALAHKMSGDVQIHHTGYQDSLESNPYKMLIPFSDSAVGALKQSSPLVSDIAPRLRVMGLLNHQKSQTTTPIVITGIDSEKELRVCPRMPQALREGALLDSSKERMAVSQAGDEDLGEATGLEESQAQGGTQGEKAEPRSGELAQAGYHQIMLTPSLMRGMSAKIGDEMVILVSDKDNMQQAIIARITGVVDYALPGVSGRMAWMDFRTLQKVLHLDGQASELAIRVNGDANVAKIQLTAGISNQEIVETSLETVSLMRDAIELQNYVFSAVLFIVFTIVIAAIVNTSLMTVMERTREIGTLMALGYRRRHILGLFLGEFAVIGVAGAALGLFTASVVVMLLNFSGVPFTLPGQTVNTVLYPAVSVPFLLLVFGLAVMAALVAGIVPAYRASHMRPVQALSSV